MPPKKGKGSRKDASKSKDDEPPRTEKFEIDISKIPMRHRYSIDLTSRTARIEFACIVCCIRTLSCNRGNADIVFGSKKAIVDDKTPSYENLFLFKLINHKAETEVVISLNDIYLYGVVCNGNWYYTENDYYTIKGGFAFPFSEKYPNNFEYKVGMQVVRLAVETLHGTHSAGWATAFYNLAVNIAESVRFQVILLKFLEPGVFVLCPQLQWLINHWTNLSKFWKIWVLRGLWNPRNYPCEGIDEVDAESMLAIVKDMVITEKEMNPAAGDDTSETEAKSEAASTSGAAEDNSEEVESSGCGVLWYLIENGLKRDFVFITS